VTKRKLRPAPVVERPRPEEVIACLVALAAAAKGKRINTT
jgi:hypothetical protein